MTKNIFFCTRYQRWYFQKMINNKLYKKMFRTRPEAERYRDYFYITYYDGINVNKEKYNVK